jgi:amidophosphoribosyltransferase
MDFENDKPREECGVFAIVAKDPAVHVAQTIFHGLVSLQHRGQEAAGLSIADSNKQIYTYKDKGLVFQALPMDVLSKLWGNVGIGHVRYGTAGSGEVKNAQPFHYETTHTTFSIVFNGNITNYQLLKEKLKNKGRIFLTDGDTEVIANLIASNTQATESWVENLEIMAKLLDGSYSLVLLTKEGDLYAIRDPSGNKPLIFGTATVHNTEMYIIASESAAITALGGKIVRDVKPGEIIHVHYDHFFHTEKIINGHKIAHCYFEYVYFARGDSVIDQQSVHLVRKKLGKNLAKSNQIISDHAIVCPVPDSGRSAALGYAEESGHPYEEGLMKNRYVFRSFIAPSQAERMNLVRMKLDPVRETVEGKEVILVDDSIVRGTTMERIVRLLRDAGAEKVHVRSSAPPIVFPCHYGIDFPKVSDLIYGRKNKADYNETVDAIRQEIGADTLAYQTIDGLVDALGLPREEVCLGCLIGEYFYSHLETKKYLGDGRI